MENAHSKKKKPLPSLLIRSLGLVVASLILCYIFTILAFSAFGLDAYADLQKDEMSDRTEYIAEITASYLEGSISRERYKYMLGKDKNIWNASVYAYNAYGTLIMRTAGNDFENHTNIIKQFLPQVLSGNRIHDTDIILTGIPVTSSMGNTIGAVFMIKPVNEVKAAMRSVRHALSLSLVLAFAAMISPVYIVASYGISKPIRKMTIAAEEMADGNYTTVNIKKNHGEIASLGRSLNALSKSLSKTVGDLSSERNMLREILNGMADGVLAFDLNNRMLQHNPAAIKLMGGTTTIPIDSNVMRTIIDSIPSIDRSSPEPLEFHTQCNDRILHIRMSYIETTYIIPSADTGSHIGSIILVLLHDATEAARYEQSRKDYVANVSHELRTPIANIKGISEALCDGIIKAEDSHKYYEHLYKESDRLSRLINDLLELSRMQSGKLSLEKRKTDLFELIMGVSDSFAETAREHGIDIMPICDDGLFALTNEDRIEQILVILVDNAIKHSESKAVTIRVCDHDSDFIVSVENKGTIDENDLPHLFERFYKADKSHSQDGSGLGLSIASEIISMLDESIWVKNENDIVSFSFTLMKYRQ